MTKYTFNTAIAEPKPASANILIKSIKISFLMLVSFVLISAAAISAPLSKATVTLTNSSTGKTCTCVTDANGKFECKNLPDGKYTFSCTSEDKMMSWSWGETQTGSYEFDVKAPRDVATGQASGKRMHKPFTIKKELDKSTPLLGKQAGSTKSTKDHNSSRSNKCVADVCVDGSSITGTLSDK